MSIHDEADAVVQAADAALESARIEAIIARVQTRAGCLMARAVLARSHGADWHGARVAEYRLDATRRLYVAVLSWHCPIHDLDESETCVLLRPDAQPVFIELTETAQSAGHVPPEQLL